MQLADLYQKAGLADLGVSRTEFERDPIESILKANGGATGRRVAWAKKHRLSPTKMIQRLFTTEQLHRGSVEARRYGSEGHARYHRQITTLMKTD